MTTNHHNRTGTRKRQPPKKALVRTTLKNGGGKITEFFGKLVPGKIKRMVRKGNYNLDINQKPVDTPDINSTSHHQFPQDEPDIMNTNKQLSKNREPPSEILAETASEEDTRENMNKPFFRQQSLENSHSEQNMNEGLYAKVNKKTTNKRNGLHPLSQIRFPGPPPTPKTPPLLPPRKYIQTNYLNTQNQPLQQPETSTHRTSPKKILEQSSPKQTPVPTLRRPRRNSMKEYYKVKQLTDALAAAQKQPSPKTRKSPPTRTKVKELVKMFEPSKKL